MTPNYIEVLIHCHTAPCIHPRIDALVVMGAIEKLLKQDLIFKMGGQEYYVTTKRGKAHMKQLCDLEIPKQAWVDANGEIIDIGG